MVVTIIIIESRQEHNFKNWITPNEEKRNQT